MSSSDKGAEVTVSQSVPSQTSEKNRTQSWFTLHRSNSTTKEEIHKEYSGSRGYNGYHFTRPTRRGAKDEHPEKIVYRNQFGEDYSKHQDVATYLSGTQYIPRRVIIQATAHVTKTQPNTKWRRSKLEGSVPTALRLSQWALKPAENKYGRDDETGEVVLKRRGFFAATWGYINSTGRCLLVAIPLQLYLSLPLASPPWEEDDVEDKYPDWPGYCWQWPKFAVNPLDMKPSEHAALKFSAKPRLLRPRLLVTKDLDGNWTVKNLNAEPHAWKPYVMVSYTNLHYQTNTSVEGRNLLDTIAKKVAVEAGCQAYWMDFKCRAPLEEPELLTSDVNRFCDVIRGATRVVVALPNEEIETAKVWGSRMWTLPEGLLATGDNVYFHYTNDTNSNTKAFSKLDMAVNIWEDAEHQGENIQATRLLAEHFTGGVDLSRLQLFSTALLALSDRKPSDGRPADRPELSYALMGLLSNRIDPDPHKETIFQSIARLCLCNDSDRLIDRMLCLLPRHDTAASASADPFEALAQADQFKTHLWDITPEAHVIGVAEQDRTVVVDCARAIPIRWKQFPRMRYRRAPGFRKFLAEMFIRSGAWWFIAGLSLVWTYAPLFLAFHDTDASDLLKWLESSIMLFFLVGIALSLAGPVSCRRLFGGSVTEMSPNLIGFEGVLPLIELETKIFGNYNGRLDYEPSGTPYSLRSPHERAGLEPKFITHPDQFAPEPALASSEHRLFTLVDTGSLTVNVFQATAPPTVALICGREGGMLRALLCSWDFASDRLMRQTVVRMGSDCLDMVRVKGWVKVCLGEE
ncbi:hypothetical protein K402DRAFT_394109 [Aulographum hederae CBS 113979]|uniref:Heterokaryon incompatibility domain-containing protein n=1 Tax=Aulographum hederae CBS 113979 TaxID=1176131 RepID=A0A6G1GZQ2_9PEZI|nr:hypothetical protein K402DRAFT_394109 [Aulographum hederae CBS 113979]